MTPWATVISLAATLTVLTGCTSGPDAADRARTASPGPAPSSSAWPTEVAPLPTASGVIIDEDTGEVYEPEQLPEWDGASRRTARDAAVAVMEAFAATDVPRDTWWRRLEPHLTQLAAQDYAWVDPANVPVGRVTGEPEIVEAGSGYVGRVEVPTDIGPYLVTVVREDADAPWLVDRLTPPAE
ncbi:hypothetical protein [Myceligenerans crystallogenes]|uniref:Lipoprotein n=1 Tax=Myceligenerans crystallogenes TaxID=316335 RepID=A0ABN2NG71_9MICO